LIMRHAISSWDDPSLADFDRPLNARGLRDAQKMSAALRTAGLVPDVVIASTAVRARDTAELVCQNIGRKISIDLEPNIYEASPQVLLNIVVTLDEENAGVMMIGHNPGMEGLVFSLTGELANMPTAAVAHIESRADSWIDVAHERAKLVRVFRPKELGW